MTNVIKQIVNGSGDSQSIKMIVRDNERGPQGEQGEPGEAATVSIGTTSTLPAGSQATVQNAGTSSAAVLAFGIPKGDKGDAGVAATVEVGATDTLPSGYPAIVTNSGSTTNAVLDFKIPMGPRGARGDKGEKGDTGATGATGPQGETGQQGPQGDPGDAATITVGTVTTLPAGSNATVTNTGTSSAAVFDFGIPKGADGGYILPVATASTLGGVKVGGNLSMGNDDKLSAVVPTKTSDLTNDGSDGTSTYVESDDLATVATTGAYSDLSGTPTIPTQKMWYGTCTTAANDATKVVTTQTGNYALVDGNTVAVRFSYYQGLDLPVSLNVDGQGAIIVRYSSHSGIWSAGDIVEFVYVNGAFYMIDRDVATHQTYGMTKLYTGVDSGSNALAASASAVKIAYDAIKDSTITITNNGSTVDSFTVNAASDKTIALTAPVITMQTTDPGEGTTLAANNFVAVYDNAISFLDIFYPVGSYYETSNTAFDPNTAWGGTWTEDTAGKVLVAYSSGDTDFDTVGGTGGEKTHTLTTTEMPSHTHKTINYTAGYTGGAQSGFRTVLSGTETSQDYDAVKSTGGGGAHNNLQPYVVIKRWHRTA